MKKRGLARLVNHPVYLSDHPRTPRAAATAFTLSSRRRYCRLYRLVARTVASIV